jgi:hypothetical protein
MNARIKFSLCLLLVMSCLSTHVSAEDTPSTPVLDGGRFAFSYPNFTGAPGGMTVMDYLKTCAGGFHTPDTYLEWIASGTDIRLLNPSGVYLKHINLRTIETSTVDLSHPDSDYVVKNHPEWILKDRNGNWVTIFGGTNYALDFGNDAYLDWALNTWMPNQYLDSTDSDPSRITWYAHDNGNFDRMYFDYDPNDPVGARYNTVEGVQAAWEHLLDRWNARWPNKRLVISTGSNTYQPIATQMAWLTRVLSKSAGYFCEALTSDFVYWSDQPNSGKRTALITTMQLASWLADNNKVFYPNLGMDGDNAKEPTQAQVDYAWAFFNLMRKGDWQFFSRVTRDANGFWQPRIHPEMDLPLGDPLEERQEISPNVYRRSFEHAIAYVNLSDNAVSISLPSGTHMNSLRQAVISPLKLDSFSGLTVYH